MSGTLPNWLEQWLQPGPAGAGEGTLWHLTYSWRWPSWLTLVAAVAAIGWIAVCYARESGLSRHWRFLLAGLRMMALAIVVVMLAQVSLALERTGLPTVALLIDRSASMGTIDRYEDPRQVALIDERLKRLGQPDASRLNLAKSLLLNDEPNLVDRLAQRYQLRVFTLADHVDSVAGPADRLAQEIRAWQADGPATRLGAGLREVLVQLRGTAPAAVIVLTDGINTDGESLADAAHFAWQKGVPLYPVALGSSRPIRDLELSDLLVDDVVFVNDVVDFQFKAAAANLAGQEVEAVLRASGADEPLAKVAFQLSDDGQPQHVHLTYRPPEEGEFDYVVSVAPIDDEPNRDNNKLARSISVRKKQIRVLLVQGKPNYEFRYLKNLLARDPTIELHTVLVEADPEYAQVDAQALRVFPVRREELMDYDVLIYGDVDPRSPLVSRSAQESIVEFVEKKGRGLAVVAGPDFMPLAYADSPLARLLPIDVASSAADARPAVTEGFRPQPTELGLSSPQMQLGSSWEESAEVWRNLPSLFWLMTSTRKPTALVLAEHSTLSGADGRQVPVILQQYVGAGKVLYHATDETWRWRFRVGDVFMARYWVQAVRYLARAKAGEQVAALATERTRYHSGEAVRLRVRFNDERVAPPEDDGVSVVIERSAHANQTLTLTRNATHRGVFEATLPGVEAGAYHAWLASPNVGERAPTADFAVLPPAGEAAHVQTDLKELERAVAEREGRVYTLADAARLIDDLPPGRPVPIEALPPWTIWNRWWLLSLLLVCLCAEWAMRKRKGLL